MQLKNVDHSAGVPIVTQDPWGRLEIKYAFRCDWILRGPKTYLL